MGSSFTSTFLFGEVWNFTSTSTLNVSFSGFIGSSIDNQYIGNIPINTLNCSQQIYLTLPFSGYDIFDPDVFYIKLITKFDTLDS